MANVLLIVLLVLSCQLLAAPPEATARPEFLEELKPDDVTSVVFLSKGKPAPDTVAAEDPPPGTRRILYEAEVTVAGAELIDGLVAELKETGQRGDQTIDWAGYLPPHVLVDSQGHVLARVTVYVSGGIVFVSNGADFQKHGDGWLVEVTEDWPPKHAPGYQSAHGINQEYARIIYDLLWQAWPGKARELEEGYKRVGHPLPILLFGREEGQELIDGREQETEKALEDAKGL